MIGKSGMTPSAENLIMKIFETCAGHSGCDVCRLHMENDCLFFPELYRLNDTVKDPLSPFNPDELLHLLDLCTLCGLCPCPDIRMLILQAKAAVAEHNIIPFSGAILSNPEKIGRWGTRLFKTANHLGRLAVAFPVLKKILQIHPDSCLPVFPEESFFSWADKRGLTAPIVNDRNRSPKVAYFAGCSAGYLFPEVGRATVRILEQNKIRVFVPHQECCGMPLIMEGRQRTAIKKIRNNIEILFESIRNGYDIVCSCPTCGYFFKKLLLENAYYSDAFQESAGAGPTVMKVPSGSPQKTFSLLPRQIYQKILKDDGYFSTLDPLKRIAISNNITDMGEYLLSLFNKETPDVKPSVFKDAMAYYAPCHQRELHIGSPYQALIESFPGTDIIQIGGVMDCCGMGGHLGYKTCFQPYAQKIGKPLFERLLSEQDRIILTDCLSCKLQFQQTLPMDVFHPVELIQKIYQ